MAHFGSLGDRVVSALRSRRVAARRRGPGLRPGVEPLEGRVVPATITVRNANDSGPDSLRAAIERANLDPTQDTIEFAPAVTGTITLSSALPDLASAIVLEGPGAAALTVARSAAGETPAFRIFTVAAGAEVAITGLTLTGGRTPIEGAGAIERSGGGIFNAGTLSITASTLSGNAAVFGGGISNGEGTLTVTASTLSKNVASFGGGIDNLFGTLTVTASTFSNNATSFGGGGISSGGTLTVTASTFSNNQAPANGGGIDNSGKLTVTASTLSGNAAVTGQGGGIANRGTLTVSASTLSGNEAGSGGGIANSFGGTLTVTASTFSGNTAGSGGGISNSFGTLTVTASTFSGNAARFGGGIENRNLSNSTATLAVLGSLFANGPAGNLANEGGSVTSLGHNLFTDAPGLALDPTDLINTDPGLGPLADNGGPTFTHALLPGSSAIDAGVAVPGVATDQRGVSRPQGIAPDIGAFESRGFTLAIASGNNQGTPAGSAFAPLVVAVASPFGEPVAGGRVTFAAPPSGASATFTGNPATVGPDGQARVTATANGIGGTYAVTARAAGAPGGVDFILTNSAPVAPTVVALRRFGVHRQPTLLVLAFSAPLDAARAEDLDNYRLVALGHRRERSIPLVAARYDATAQAVTLLPGRLLSLHGLYRLAVNSRPPRGLTSVAGVPLDGAGTGRPGTDFVRTFGREILVLPGFHAGSVRRNLSTHGVAAGAVSAAGFDALFGAPRVGAGPRLARHPAP